MELITGVIAWVLANKMTLVGIATSIVAAASAISALTPGTTDDSIVGKVKSVVDKLALNVGHAKNAPQTKPADDAESGV